jgi:hypothetical protein
VQQQAGKGQFPAVVCSLGVLTFTSIPLSGGGSRRVLPPNWSKAVAEDSERSGDSYTDIFFTFKTVPLKAAAAKAAEPDRAAILSHTSSRNSVPTFSGARTRTFASCLMNPKKVEIARTYGARSFYLALFAGQTCG